MDIDLHDFLRTVPDWPKPGIDFIDITPLLNDSRALALAVERMANPFRNRRIDIVAGAESRGFIFGTALAQALSCGFIPIRKPGKLPWKTFDHTYALEYGTDTLEIHQDAIRSGQRVIIVDDLLATGGTMQACCEMINKLGGDIVGISILIELAKLQGRAKIEPYAPIHVVLSC